jgi:hypothetical protein
MRQAQQATANRNSGTATNVTGSFDSTPNNQALTNLVIAKAHAKPISNP